MNVSLHFINKPEPEPEPEPGFSCQICYSKATFWYIIQAVKNTSLKRYLFGTVTMLFLKSDKEIAVMTLNRRAASIQCVHLPIYLSAFLLLPWFSYFFLEDPQLFNHFIYCYFVSRNFPWTSRWREWHVIWSWCRIVSQLRRVICCIMGSSSMFCLWIVGCWLLFPSPAACGPAFDNTAVFCKHKQRKMNKSSNLIKKRNSYNYLSQLNVAKT